MYNSRRNTMDHKNKVKDLINGFCGQLKRRAADHDSSKLSKVEKDIFNEYTPKLKNTEYNSDEYKDNLDKMKVVLDNHYSVNSHHPEHYENGIKGMDLLDLCEMFFDWKAAAMRHKDGDILKSIEISSDRFDLSEDLKSILLNSARRLT